MPVVRASRSLAPAASAALDLYQCTSTIGAVDLVDHRPARRRRRSTRSSNAELRAAIATGRLQPGRPAADRPPARGRSAGQRQHRRPGLRRARARRRHRDPARRRLLRERRRPPRPTRRASAIGGCARSSHACSPTPTPPGSPSTRCSAGARRPSTQEEQRKWSHVISVGRNEAVAVGPRSTSSPLRSCSSSLAHRRRWHCRRTGTRSRWS